MRRYYSMTTQFSYFPVFQIIIVTSLALASSSAKANTSPSDLTTQSPASFMLENEDLNSGAIDPNDAENNVGNPKAESTQEHTENPGKSDIKNDPFDLGGHGTRFGVQGIDGDNPAEIQNRKEEAEVKAQAYLEYKEKGGELTELEWLKKIAGNLK